MTVHQQLYFIYYHIFQIKIKHYEKVWCKYFIILILKFAEFLFENGKNEFKNLNSFEVISSILPLSCDLTMKYYKGGEIIFKVPDSFLVLMIK